MLKIRFLIGLVVRTSSEAEETEVQSLHEDNIFLLYYYYNNYYIIYIRANANNIYNIISVIAIENNAFNISVLTYY